VARGPVVGLRRVAGALPLGEGRLAMVEASPEFILEWMALELPEGMIADPSYWRVDLIVSIGTRIKGGPGATAVRSPDTPVLRRYERNARFRAVARAVYPTAPTPTDAVRRWYTHGGSTQVLRWSDAEVAEFVAGVAGERATSIGRPGDGVLWIGPSHRSTEKRREERRRARGPAGSETRARYNAKRREQAARRRLRGVEKPHR
jgi:hypothetical protein